jgi:hypothetical protein
MTDAKHSTRAIVLRWALPTLALLVFGPLAAVPMAGLRDGHGGPDTTPFLSATPVVGAVALVVAAVVAGLGGGLTARVTAAGTGRTFAGLVLVWVAMRTGDSWLILADRGSGAVVPLAIEGAVVAALGLVLVATLKGLGEGKPIPEAWGDVVGSVRGKGAGLGLLVGVVAGLVGAMLVALDGMRGQCLLGGIGAGVLCAVGVQLSSPETPPETARLRASIATLVLAVVAPLTLLVMPGGTGIAEAARSGSLMGPGIVQPLDFLAGVFLGVPTGMAWVGSVSERAHAAHESGSGRGGGKGRPKRVAG